MFDQKLLEITCQCGKVSKEVLSNFDSVTTFTCPACGSITRLDAEPYRSAVKELRRVATELDKKARQRGETIERIK